MKKGFTLSKIAKGTVYLRQCKSAFTLAEVLITLSIIGIVAALTLPSLISKHQKDVTAVKVKKMYSLLQNVVMQSVAENGDAVEWYDEGSYQNGFESSSVNFNKYFNPYLKIIKTCIDGSNNAGGYKLCGYKESNIYSKTGVASVTVSLEKIPVMLSDGSILIFSPKKEKLTTSDLDPIYGYYWYIYYDVNGGRSPNRLGDDIFVFVVIPANNKILPSGIQKTVSDTVFSTKEEIEQDCLSKGLYCAAKIMLDDWKILYD